MSEDLDERAEPASALGLDPGIDRHLDPAPAPVPAARVAALGLYYLLSMVVMHFHGLGGTLALLVGLLVFGRTLWQLCRIHLLGSWKLINDEAEALRTQADPAERRYDSAPLIVATTVAVVLTLTKYYGKRHILTDIVHRLLPSLVRTRYYSLMGLAYWSVSRVFTYVGIPWVATRAFLRGRMRDYGLSTAGFVSHLKVYGLLFLIVVPPLVLASTAKPFQHTYPFYEHASRSLLDFALWELLYVLQFFALEVFFRGFMLLPLKRSLGAYAIFAQAVPYCMIHYAKPLAEASGAFVAGIALGTLSMRTRSIWAGWLIHASVAISMDCLSLWHKTG